MKINLSDKTIKGVENATIEMNKGDRVTIAFEDITGEYQVVNVTVEGFLMVIEHEQTDNAMLVKRDGTSYVTPDVVQAAKED